VALSVNELAWYFGISVAKAWQLVRGDPPAIPSLRIGRSVRVHRSAADAFLAAGGTRSEEAQ
jgi:excisionase family DNA binding protein